MRLATSIGALLLIALTIRAADPRFDVISIKPTPPERQFYVPEDLLCENGRLVSKGYPISSLITWSHQINRLHISGLPKWANEYEHGYDIEAKAAGPVTDRECQAMGRSLLAERFHMEQHRERRTENGFELTLIDGGAKLRQSAAETTINRQTIWETRGEPGISMPWLAMVLADHPAVAVPVVDKTGLAGRFVFRLTFSTREGDNLPTVFVALKNQLGLTLRRAKVETDVLVIDRIEMPTAN